MTNVMKKVSALLLTVAMAVTMMPTMVFAGETVDHFKVSVNGVDTGKTITKEWMQNNSLAPQVFPWLAKQGEQTAYAVGVGPSYENVLDYAFGLESLDELDNSTITWLNGFGTNECVLKSEKKVSELKNAVKVLSYVGTKKSDGTVEEFTGSFKDDTYSNVEVILKSGSKPVTPIISYEQVLNKDYDSATNIAKNWSNAQGKKTDIRPLLGGDLTKDTVLKKNGVIDITGINFVGKFSMVVNDNTYSLNVNIPVEKKVSSLNFETANAQTVAYDLSKLTAKEQSLVKGIMTWETSDSSVAVVDASGSVTPVAAGACTVTAKAGTAVVAEATVSVSPTVKPAKAVVKVTSSKKKVTVSWSKQSGVTGYQVYRAKKENGKFKKVATTKKTSFKNKGLKKGKTYYYKVRSFKKVGKKYKYGNFSDVMAVKVVK